MPSCSHSCRALALERAEADIAIIAARYTRQETLPALLLRYCPIFSLGCSAFLFPLKPRILELRRPSRYMEASYMEVRVYITRLRLVLQTHTRQKTFHRTRIVMYYYPLFLSTLLNTKKYKKKSSEKELRHFSFYRTGTIIFTLLAW